MTRTGRTAPSNRALAESLFALADQESPGDRRVDLLRAGYRALDATGPAGREILASSPAWLRPLVAQLVTCHGEGALTAAVERLGAGRKPGRRPARERFLSRAEVDAILREAPEELRPQRLRGAIHWHTRDSDGRGSLESMARACLRRGASWAVVSDHSRGLEVASGIDREGVRLQRRRIRRWNDTRGDELRLFQGLEVEILEDGTVDVPRVEREELDLVIAAVHRRLEPGPDQTERLLRAIETPGVRVLAHPRGRLFHHRQGIRARWEKVFAACAGRGVLIEINGFPRRQDADWELARLAAACGCSFVLASDAHAVAHLEYDAFACAIAVRAGIPARRILNFGRTEAAEDWIAEAVDAVW
ncbi:MAG TPA: hypothetical protein ENK19_04170 [Acidobacteria bacterium]|nr:hypothetical protein [Acidobacteriota bacterium]